MVAPSGPLEPLSIALATNLNYAPVFIGIEKGIFARQGIDLKVRTFALGNDAITANQAGEVDLAVANFSTLIGAKSSGATLKGFWLMENDATVVNNDQNVVLIAPPNSRIQSIADLAGKKVGYTSAGAYDPWMKQTLRDAGVDPSKVDLLNVPFPQMPSALKAANVDAAMFQEPYAQVYLSEFPTAKILVRGGNKVSFRVLTTAREDWLAKNQALAQKFSLAMAESQQYARQHRDEAADVSTRWITGLVPAVAKKAIAYYTYDPRVSQLVIDSWQMEVKSLLEAKRITESVSIEQGFDTTLPKQILQQYPQFFSDLKPTQ
ncbi:MAG: ABC transporter substrate-binding protein [Chloroflexi bacterium]|nr:ABC transporter substrate-binding protein [Chloroflexota bacterium]